MAGRRAGRLRLRDSNHEMSPPPPRSIASASSHEASAWELCRSGASSLPSGAFLPPPAEHSSGPCPNAGSARPYRCIIAAADLCARRTASGTAGHLSAGAGLPQHGRNAAASTPALTTINGRDLQRGFLPHQRRLRRSDGGRAWRRRRHSAGRPRKPPPPGLRGALGDAHARAGRASLLRKTWRQGQHGLNQFRVVSERRPLGSSSKSSERGASHDHSRSDSTA